MENQLKSISKVLVSGVITETDFNSNVFDIVRPVANITVYDDENEQWVENIYIIFTDNSSARKFRALNIGDIITVSGELSYYSGFGYAIYVDQYSIVEKNNKNSITEQKINLYDKIGYQNLIFIKGTLIYHDNQTASISHNISNKVRGSLNRHSVQPVIYTNQLKGNPKNIIFLGKFSKKMMKGEIYETL